MMTFKEFILEALMRPLKPKEGEDSTVYYHASPNEYPAQNIRPMSHFGTHRAARARGVITSVGNRTNVMAYRLRLKNGWKISDEGDSHRPQDVVNLLHRHGYISRGTHESLTNDLKKISRSKGSPQDQHNHIAEFLKSKGVDHLHYTNVAEHPGSKSVIVVDPKSSARPIFQSMKGRLNIMRGEKDSV